MKSNEIYEKMMSETTAKGKVSLRNIKKVCDSLEERGLCLSVALIGRETDRNGLSPCSGAIRNNKKLLTYINARVLEYEKGSEVVYCGDLDLKERVTMLEN